MNRILKSLVLVSALACSTVALAAPTVPVVKMASANQSLPAKATHVLTSMQPSLRVGEVVEVSRQDLGHGNWVGTAVVQTPQGQLKVDIHEPVTKATDHQVWVVTIPTGQSLTGKIAFK